jgi:teichoic acid transport system permease protein
MTIGTSGSSTAVDGAAAPESSFEPIRLTPDEAAARARGAGLEELGVRPRLTG